MRIKCTEGESYQHRFSCRSLTQVKNHGDVGKSLVLRSGQARMCNHCQHITHISFCVLA